MRKDVLQAVKSLITSAKKSVDIGNGIAVLKIGKDPKGNWSYWVSTPKKKSIKIQTINLDGGSGKVEDIKQFQGGDKDGDKAIKLIKEYLK